MKIKEVVDFVISERERMGVADEDLGYDFRFELSCIAFGEFNNLLYSQLIFTRIGYGDWLSLEHPEILDGLLEFINKIKIYRGGDLIVSSEQAVSLPNREEEGTVIRDLNV